MLHHQNEVKSCESLLRDFHQKNNQNCIAEKLIFYGVERRDVYNITAPFMDKGKHVIAGRVESRETERSDVMFFFNQGGIWSPMENTKTFNLQDPFFTFINGELIFGGVEVLFDPEHPEKVKNWRTLFYRGIDIDHLELFAVGPEHMKDIRLIEQADGRIGVFTRPLDVEDVRALIGYTEIKSLVDLNEAIIAGAPLFRDQFLKNEWGGVNETLLLKNGLIGVLGHIAYMEEGDIRHYHAMTFAFDPKTRAKTPIKIIAVRNQFPDGPAKRNDLIDVIFSGGIQRLSNKRAMLYAGVSDTEAHHILISDPFFEYENLQLGQVNYSLV
jgi:hypothetical protein